MTRLSRRQLIAIGGLSLLGVSAAASSNNSGPTVPIGIGGGPQGTFVLEVPVESVVRNPGTDRSVDAVRLGTGADTEPGRLRLTQEEPMRMRIRS